MESNASADHREPCTTGKVARQNEWPGDERLLPGRACTDSPGLQPSLAAGSFRASRLVDAALQAMTKRSPERGATQAGHPQVGGNWRD